MKTHMPMQQYTETIPLPSDVPADIKQFIHEDVQLAYSPTTGKCYRLGFNSQNPDLKFAKWRLIKPGTLDSTYTVIRISGSNHTLHRVIGQHFLNNGRPLTDTNYIDHREHANGTHQQDMLDNLRITSNRGNHGNRKDGTSKFSGVSWHTRTKKWRTQIVINKQPKDIGLFHSEIEAAKAYIQTGEKHGFDMTIARERFRSIAGYAIG